MLVAGLMVMLMLGGNLIELSIAASGGHGTKSKGRGNNGNNQFLDHFNTSFLS